MKIKYQNFLSNNFFFLILLFAVIIVVFFSYYRFLFKQDYMVRYEGVCDPMIEQCFIGHDGDEQYFYSDVQKYAPDLFKECGSDITDCELANVCLSNDNKCSVTYCDVEINGNICDNI